MLWPTVINRVACANEVDIMTGLSDPVKSEKRGIVCFMYPKLIGNYEIARWQTVFVAYELC
jgi:hypothetical protein